MGRNGQIRSDEAIVLTNVYTRQKKTFGSSVSYAAAIRSLIKKYSKKKVTLTGRPNIFCLYFIHKFRFFHY